MNITIKYSCHQCGIRDADVSVPARGDEEVTKWLDSVTVLVAENHALIRPHCKIDRISELKIPMVGTEKVGGPVLN